MTADSGSGQQQCPAYCLIGEAQYAKPTILLDALEAFRLCFVQTLKTKKEIDS